MPKQNFQLGIFWIGTNTFVKVNSSSLSLKLARTGGPWNQATPGLSHAHLHRGTHAESRARAQLPRVLHRHLNSFAYLVNRQRLRTLEDELVVEAHDQLGCSRGAEVSGQFLVADYHGRLQEVCCWACWGRPRRCAGMIFKITFNIFKLERFQDMINTSSDKNWNLRLQ